MSKSYHIFTMQKEDRFFKGHHVHRCRIFRPTFESDFFVFILRSRETHEGAMRRTNPDSFRSCLDGFQIFHLNFASDFFDSLLSA